MAQLKYRVCVAPSKLAVPDDLPLGEDRRTGLHRGQAEPVRLPGAALVDHGVDQTRQAAGVGRPRLRVVLPPRLPDALAVEAASELRSAAAAAEVDLVWMEAPLDAGFSLIQQRQADAGLGWLTDPFEALPAPLDVMSLGDFEPDVWVPAAHPAARRGTISLDVLFDAADGITPSAAVRIGEHEPAAIGRQAAVAGRCR
jgi:hypothetical protein